MTRRTFRYDEAADMFYEVGGSNYFDERTESGPAVISDDLGAGVNGLRNHADGRMHDSKSGFRKATLRAGCVEIGNESTEVKPRELISRREIGETLKRAYEEHQSFGSDATKRARLMYGYRD